MVQNIMRQVCDIIIRHVQLDVPQWRCLSVEKAYGVDMA